MSVENIVEKLTEQSGYLAEGELHNSFKEVLEKTEVPTRKDEAWRYLAVDKLFDSTYAVPASNSLTAELVDKHTVSADVTSKLVFVDGVYNAELSSVSSGNAVVCDMKTAKTEYADVYAANFGKTKLGLQGKIESLNAAFAQNGAFIYIKPGKAIDETIEIIHIATSENIAIAQVRNLIVAGKGSISKVVEVHVSEADSKLLVNASTEVVVAEDANLEYNSLYTVSPSDVEISSIVVEQQRSSVFTGNTLMISGKVLRSNIKVEHAGEHCETNLNGLYFAKGKEHFDNYTEIFHNKPNCTTNELYKGLVGDSATGVFVGNVVVAKDAQQTLANQTNQNILLSEDATIHSKPQLEIWADDVACSHGSTTGQLDKDQLYYMQARGIDREKAVQLLLHAFLADVSEKLSIPAFKEKVEELIEAKM